MGVIGFNGGIVGPDNTPTQLVASGVWSIDELFLARDADIWPGLPVAEFAMELITPTSINFTGTSASIVGNGSVDFSAVSVLSLNGVFSADYDNYMLVIRHVHNIGSPAFYLRMRASGADSTTGYVWQHLQANGTSVSGVRNSTEGFARIDNTSNTQRSGTTVFCYGPNLGAPTALRGISALGSGGASVFEYASTHSVSSAYDGVTLQPSSGNITGNVAVYGLRG